VLPDLGDPEFVPFEPNLFYNMFRPMGELSNKSRETWLLFLDQHMAEVLKPHRTNAKLSLKRWMDDVAELLRLIEPDVILPVYAKTSASLCRRLLKTAKEVVARSL